jgi:glutamate 5-kinase
VDEIKFGDNDNLSALVTNVAEADLLLILTDVAGLFSADPNGNPDARLIPLVKAITREVERLAGGAGSGVGTGGMATKITAAKKAGKNGVPTIMVPGKQEGVITAALLGREVGTLFLPESSGLNRRKYWIAYTLKPSGRVVVDEGAREVLLKKGKSLLPSGVLRVEGRFDRGACERLAGRKSSEIEAILGYRYGDVIVHRDNMVVV